MMSIIVMDLSLVDSEKSLKNQNMYIPHMEYKDISHGKKKGKSKQNICKTLKNVAFSSQHVKWLQ